MRIHQPLRPLVIQIRKRPPPKLRHRCSLGGHSPLRTPYDRLLHPVLLLGRIQPPVTKFDQATTQIAHPKADPSSRAEFQPATPQPPAPPLPRSPPPPGHEPPARTASNLPAPPPIAHPTQPFNVLRRHDPAIGVPYSSTTNRISPLISRFITLLQSRFARAAATRSFPTTVSPSARPYPLTHSEYRIFRCRQDGLDCQCFSRESDSTAPGRIVGRAVKPPCTEASQI